MLLDLDATNKRLIKNEAYAHRKLANHIIDILAIKIPELEFNIDSDQGWVVNGDPIVGALTNFTGIIDIETTGFFPEINKVICAVGIGWMNDELVVAIHGSCDKLPVFHSVVANINQPFDRSFYYIENGDDTNIHIDLSSMITLVHGDPNPASPFRDYPSLSDTHELYFGTAIDKADRELLIKGELAFQDTVRYCFRDVAATVKVAQKLIPDFVEMNPSPISLNGICLRHYSIPMSDKLDGYYDRVESWYQSKLEELKLGVQESAIRFLTSDHPSHLHLLKEYPEALKQPKPLIKKVSAYPESKLRTAILDAIQQGNPRAFNKKLLECLDDPSFKSSWLPMMICATYNNLPLLYHRKQKKWFYGDNELKNISNPKAALSTPFTKDYFESDLLGSDSSDIVQVVKSTVIWVLFRERMKTIRRDEFGYHNPQYTPVGTLTGRSKDQIFLLIAKPKPDVGGTEFLKYIEAKPGYKLVVADFDSSELIMASHLACYYEHVTNQLDCEFAEMVLNGDQRKKTDIHSFVAMLLGIPRGNAKNIVYGSNYLQGMEARTQALMSITGKSYAECRKLNQLFVSKYLQGKANSYFECGRKYAEAQLPTILLLSDLPGGFTRAAISDYFTTRNNRVIQALGSDQMNLLITDMEREIHLKELDATLILTRHDEFIYHVREDQVFEFSATLQESHRFTVECILGRIGVEEAVEKWLYFESVDVMDRYCEDKPITPTEMLQ